MKEIVVISGKGGTGKTSVAASLAVLGGRVVVADCDVDAADLHLILEPTIMQSGDFSGGKSAVIQSEACVGCGVCADACRFRAIALDGPGNDVIAKTYNVDELRCEGCGLCERLCPTGAIQLHDRLSGEWFVSTTRVGPMVHAKLGIAAENSGKLVSLVREKARRKADEEGIDLVIIDGPPGIGCPVIATLTGADLVLIVTEPSRSALHDMERVCELTRHFGLPTVICINKCDVHAELALDVEKRARELGFPIVGRIPFDPVVTRAQCEGRTVVEHTNGKTQEEIQALWSRMILALNRNDNPVSTRMEIGALALDPSCETPVSR